MTRTCFPLHQIDSIEIETIIRVTLQMRRIEDTLGPKDCQPNIPKGKNNSHSLSCWSSLRRVEYGEPPPPVPRTLDIGSQLRMNEQQRRDESASKL